jgi:hypothetical protein
VKILTKDYWRRRIATARIRESRRNRDEERLMNNPNAASLYQLQSRVLSAEYHFARYRDTYIEYYGKNL